MDQHSEERLLELYQYIEEQRNNPIDLSSTLPDQNEMIRSLANTIFDRSEESLSGVLNIPIFDSSMETADIFCLLVELLLYGLKILSSDDIKLMDLESSFEDIIFKLRKYFQSIGFKLQIREVNDYSDTCLYRDRDDYYCQIVPKLPSYFCLNDWSILQYRLINNPKFQYNTITLLEQFQAFVITKFDRILVINFKSLMI